MFKRENIFYLTQRCILPCPLWDLGVILDVSRILSHRLIRAVHGGRSLHFRRPDRGSTDVGVGVVG